MAIRTRREFLIASALTVGAFAVSTGLGGCGSDSSSGAKGSFKHGVASGDPLQNSVILWTRVTPDAAAESIEVSYEVATDAAFSNLVRPAESFTVKKAFDYTLKVDFQNLQSGSVYYYRFKVGNTVSPVGRTKTLPEGVLSQARFAVFSCANYPNGYFNAYAEAAKIADLDATLHLGDYIYEYGMFKADGVTPDYATSHAKEYGRELASDNATELFTLDDYRKRYAIYHTDTGLQAVHAACPMIAVWDDHEVANDTYKDGAENHNEGEGSFEARKMAALQAYFEWIPIRPSSDANYSETIYRTFTYGDLLSLHMLDTRVIGRDKQLSYGDFPELITTGDSSNFVAAIMNPQRTIMGNEQTQWLQGQMIQSTTTWDVLGQQVLMARMMLPAELLLVIASLEGADETTKPVLLSQLSSMLTELYTIKLRANASDPTLTAEELARINTVVPYNLDAWDGYGYSREVVLQTASSLGKNLVVLAGDTHNAWASELKMFDNTYQPTIPVGVEFATTSVTSPGMEEYAGLTDTASAMQFETVITELIDDLKYFNANNRGFMSVTFTKEAAMAEWIFVDSVASETYATLTTRSKKLKTVAGSASLTSV